MKNEFVITAQDSSAWFRKWFDSSFYHQLYGHRNEEEAASFIEALLAELDPAHGSSMLDLGCGAGRHAKYLAAKGFNVTGLDLAASGIRQAKKWESACLHFARHDMREPFGENRFDYVFNFFTSFGYFETEEENHLVLQHIFNALKPGGRLVLDYINAFNAVQRSLPEERKEIDGIRYHITRWKDSRHFHKKIVIDDLSPGGKKAYSEKVARLSLKDFENMFMDNGLRLQNVYGDYRLRSFELQTSPRLILVAKK